VGNVKRLRKTLAGMNYLGGRQSKAIKTLNDVDQALEGKNAKMKNELEDNVEKVGVSGSGKPR